MPDLSSISTRELVEELRGREAVDAVVVDPHSTITVLAEGPAIVLIITD